MKMKNPPKCPFIEHRDSLYWFEYSTVAQVCDERSHMQMIGPDLPVILNEDAIVMKQLIPDEGSAGQGHIHLLQAVFPWQPITEL